MKYLFKQAAALKRSVVLITTINNKANVYYRKYDIISNFLFQSVSHGTNVAEGKSP